MKFTLILIVCFFAVGSVMANDPNTIEPLAGINIDNGMISIKVKSTGCTTNDNFEINYLSEDQVQQIKILRTKPDRCRRMPKFLWLSLPLNTEKTTLTILNPFRVVN